MFNELLWPLKEAVGANAAAEPTRNKEAIVSFMVGSICIGIVRFLQSFASGVRGVSR